MEEEKKKKKNKKKKNKQAKATEKVAVDNGEGAHLEQNHMAVPEQNHCVQHLGSKENENAGLLDLNSTLDNGQTDEAQSAMVEEVVRQFEAEKQNWLQRDAMAEEVVRQFGAEKQGWLQRETRLEEEINQVASEKHSWFLKEANLEKEIKCLENEKKSWIVKEHMAMETIARLSEVNQGLETQVKEMEESWDGLLRERQQLMENIYVLESRIQKLGRESFFPASSSKEETAKHVPKDEDLSVQIEAACALVEKLIAENAELVEKVNDLYIELDRCRRPAGDSSTVTIDPSTAETSLAPAGDSLMARTAGTSVVTTDQSSDSIEKMESSDVIDIQMVPENEEICVGDDNPKDFIDLAGIQPEKGPEVDHSSVVIENVTSTSKENHAKEEVPLTDAPLIGAPFRLISFVTKYVSGADLVNPKK